MSEKNYEVGYGKPPKAYQFKKLQSGNPTGRRQKPPPTIAGIIEEVLLEPLPITIGGVQRKSTGLELIAMGLLVKVSDGNRKAHRALRKYEAFAKTKPRLRKLGWTLEERAQAYEHYLKVGKWPKRDKKKQVKIFPDESKRQALAARTARMRAGLEEPKILDGMTATEAADMYSLSLKQPVQPKRPRIRPRKRNLSAGEIFDQIINSPVTVQNNGQLVTASRILAVIKRLLANAVRGDTKCADMLITMHVESLKYGDFVLETEYRKR